MIEVLAAGLGASLSFVGLSYTSFSRRNSETREAVVRLTVAVESLSEKLGDLHEDLRQNKREIYDRLQAHESRISGLEHIIDSRRNR